MLVNKRKILYVTLCLSSVYGWSYPKYITDEYENRNRVHRISSNVYGNINCHYPSHDFRCRHQAFRPYNFDENYDDNRYSEEHYKQTIPELLQEIKSHVINLSASRYQPFFVQWPDWFYPQKKAGVDLPNPTNKPEIVNKYPNEGNRNQNNGPNIFNRRPSEDDTNQNWGLNPDTDFDPNRIWGTNTNNKNNTTKSECNCEKTKATAPVFQQRYSVDSSTRCKAAALYCCISGNTKQQQEYCFESQGCLDSYKTGYACLPAVIRAIYAELYKDILKRN